MPTIPPPRPSIRSRFSAIDWVTLLTAGPTWMAICRAFRAGPYPFRVPVVDRADRRAGWAGGKSSTERGVNGELPSCSPILERRTMEPGIVAENPNIVGDAAHAVSGGIP